MSPTIAFRSGDPVDDAELSALHARAFGNEPGAVVPWGERLTAHSLAWVCAFDDDRLVGFVHACWDGGLHAFLLDAVVEPTLHRTGIGTELVERLAEEVQRAGCEWLHVDYEPHLRGFYEERCGFRASQAGVRRL